MVTSVNGKSTKGSDSPQKWASAEDQAFFHSMLNKHNLLVMGSKTYESAKPGIRLEKGKLRLILTKNPKKYQKEEVKGQLEFSNESPEILVRRFEKLGYKTMLLLGGSTINALFFKEKLVDELWLTLEPKIFGTGLGFVDGGDFETKLTLKTIKKLNTKGTLLLQYQVHPAPLQDQRKVQDK